MELWKVELQCEHTQPQEMIIKATEMGIRIAADRIAQTHQRYYGHMCTVKAITSEKNGIALLL